MCCCILAVIHLQYYLIIKGKTVSKSKCRGISPTIWNSLPCFFIFIQLSFGFLTLTCVQALLLNFVPLVCLFFVVLHSTADNWFTCSFAVYSSSDCFTQLFFAMCSEYLRPFPHVVPRGSSREVVLKYGRSTSGPETLN